MTLKLGTRKVCSANRYARSLTLPKVWLENVGLKVGDIVTLEMQEDGSLIVKAKLANDELGQ